MPEGDRPPLNLCHKYTFLEEGRLKARWDRTHHKNLALIARKEIRARPTGTTATRPTVMNSQNADLLQHIVGVGQNLSTGSGLR